MKIIYKDGHVDECPQDQELHVIRHTAAHVMAQAIKRLYPEADFAFGPATENGFYYDVDLGDTKLTDEDLANIEKEMRKITKENLAIKPFILPRAEAVKLMEERHENYKVEHMADLADETEFSFFQQGEYVDMCIGPHLTYTKALKAFKITQQSGAYWKNDKENKMLTRINGVAFHNQEELDAWEKEQQEARERDHRKIGKEMGLFMTDDLVGRGLPMFLPGAGELYQGEGARPRLPARYDSLHRHRESVQDFRPLGPLPREYVPRYGDGGRELRPAPDELPPPHDDLRKSSPLLP